VVWNGARQGKRGGTEETFDEAPARGGPHRVGGRARSACLSAHGGHLARLVRGRATSGASRGRPSWRPEDSGPAGRGASAHP
jgi:hypothetical protein